MRTIDLPCPPLPPGRANLILAGFMGSGKTTIGRRAAAELGLPFFDLDQEVEAAAGRPVSEILRADGETAFRRLEEEALLRAANLSGAVIATGGGAVLHRQAWAQLTRGAAVQVLDCSDEEVRRRCGRKPETRPLLEGLPLGELRRSRAAAYRAAGPPLDTTGLSPATVTREVTMRYLAQAPAGPVRLDGGAAGVVAVGTPLGLGKMLGELDPTPARAVVICDRRLVTAQASDCREDLAGAGLEVGVIPVASGEAGKRPSVLMGLWRDLLRLGVDRHDVVVAVGGGATLDVAGFAAATFARGVRLVNVPTTLLAMADAAIGGKVAIDLDGVKNAVGSFHQPDLVVCDPRMLGGLPDPVLIQGLAEVVKSEVLGSPLALRLLLREGTHRAHLQFLVEQAVRVKLAHVAADPRDHGVRMALNLGHTYAHGLETASAYALSHGEAVAIGLVAACRLGEHLELAPAGLADQLESLLLQLGLPSRPPAGTDLRQVQRAMQADKKRRAGELRLILPGPLGTGAQMVKGVAIELATSFLVGGPAAVANLQELG